MARVLAVLPLLLAALAALPSAAEPLPYSAAVSVRAAGPAGSQALAVDLEHAVLEELAAKRCFAGALSRAGEPDSVPQLLVEVTVRDYEEQQINDQTLSSLNDPLRPPDAGPTLSYEIEGQLGAQVLTAERDLVRDKRMVLRVDYDPTLAGEGREEAYALWIREASRKVSSFVCSGSPKRWRTDIERATERRATR